MGPIVSYKTLDFNSISLNVSYKDLDSMIFENESRIMDLKPDNQARIVWADSTKAKTKYAIVYLHGFSASQEEGNPIHRDVAKEFGFNLYLSRLYDHGRDDKNSFKSNSPQKLLDSAKEALEIGKMIGDSIILMSCSTGGTLSVMLANEPLISSFIMYSPNFDLYDKSSYLITKPWGEDVLDLVMKGKYNHVNYDSMGRAYWNPDYHTDGLIALRWILDNYMTEANFEKIKKPVFIGYYYKDEDHKDEVVSISAMKNFMEIINTPNSKKSLIAFPNTGTHVISSQVMSHDIESVRRETIKFLKEL